MSGYLRANSRRAKHTHDSEGGLPAAPGKQTARSRHDTSDTAIPPGESGRIASRAIAPSRSEEHLAVTYELSASQGTSSVAEVIANLERQQLHRQAPDLDGRWALFQWLCVVGDWPRALRQLDRITELSRPFAPTANRYRRLILGEVRRKQVFQAHAEPSYLVERPQWMARLLVALAFMQNGDHAAADTSRDIAFSMVSCPPLTINGERIEWIADFDSRLGPTCELLVDGQYIWLPFSQLHRLELDEPRTLLDHIWSPVTIALPGDRIKRGFMPMRYPDSEHGVDDIRLSRRMTSRNVGRTGIICTGLRQWKTSLGTFAQSQVAKVELLLPRGARTKLPQA